MLPQFPDFFKEIYEMRQNLGQVDPQLLADLEKMYEQVRAKEEKEKQE